MDRLTTALFDNCFNNHQKDSQGLLNLTAAQILSDFGYFNILPLLKHRLRLSTCVCTSERPDNNTS
jgi:hypothetical protein